MRFITSLFFVSGMVFMCGFSVAHAQVACTMDAKLCPDGVTYVGRDGNNHCEWQPCPSGVSAPSFGDVPQTHPNADAIAYMKAKGIVAGYPDGMYRPKEAVNRAEFLKIVMSASSMRSTDFVACDEDVAFRHQRNYFKDVPTGLWYSIFICRAKDAGFVSGYPDGTFRPATDISFVEAAKIIANAFGFQVTADPIWYKPFVQVLADKQAIPPSVHSFDQLLTRGEMAEMMYRISNPQKFAQTFTQPQDIIPGQMIGKMKVVSNDYRQSGLASSIRFLGQVTLSGEYWDASAAGGMGPSGMCLRKLEILSKVGLPVRRYADVNELAKGIPELTVTAAKLQDYEGDGICFDHDDSVRKGLPQGTWGIATVVIDNFVLDLSGLEGKTNSASLERVISVRAQEKVTSVEE